jgi:L-ascorbate metabolism protein UlaG (beta-lactamase superfamily)
MTHRENTEKVEGMEKPDSTLRVTQVVHSSVLLDFNGKTIITDI